MKNKIKSIEKGWGEGSIYFTTDKENKGLYTCVDEIIEETKTIGQGYYNDLTRLVYRGYKDKKLIFEIESSSGITLRYR